MIPSINNMIRKFRDIKAIASDFITDFLKLDGSNANSNINIGSYKLNNLSILPVGDWIYLSGDGSVEAGLDIAIPKYAGRDFYYGYGGAEDHHFGIASALTIASNGDLTTAGDISGEDITAGGDLIVDDELKGARIVFDSANNTNNLSTGTSFLKYNNGTVMSLYDGYSMPRDGSIVGISGNIRCFNFTAGAPRIISFAVLINNVIKFSVVGIVINGVGRFHGEAIQARGINKFNQGDLLTMKVDNAGVGIATLQYPCCIVDCQMDT